MTTMKPEEIEARTQGSGNSIHITIPKNIAREAGIKPGDKLTIEAGNKLIKIKPIVHIEAI